MKKIPFLSIALSIALVQSSILPALALENASTDSTDDVCVETTLETAEEPAPDATEEAEPETAGGGF